VYESAFMFWILLETADSMVWGIAILMSVIAAAVLHNYTDDGLAAVMVGLALFASMMVSHVAFTVLGVMFLTDKSSNVVAAAGAAVCSVTAVFFITIRLLYAIGDRTNRLRSEN